MKFNSLPTVEQINLTNYLEMLRKFDPELYVIRIALNETGVNPAILPPIIRSVGNLSLGTGYGKIQIFMQETIITQIKGEESSQINEKATIDIL